MGVVRRNGQWRLEKREEGHYEVTYEREPQAKVLTPDYSPEMMNDASFATIPVYEVHSYAEAEGIFEERAHGETPASLNTYTGGGSSPSKSIHDGSTGFGGESGVSLDLGSGHGQTLDDVEKLPPGGIALVFLTAGGLILYVSGFAPGEPTFLVGAGIAAIGVIILAWAAFLFRTRGWNETYDFLMHVDDEASTNSGSSSSDDEPETTPPPSEKLKNELIFGRANQECEWCENHLDNPEVHHIEPRSEGGPNEPSNLIVLCPTCHRKADNGGISRTKLRGKLDHIIDR